MISISVGSYICDTKNCGVYGMKGGENVEGFMMTLSLRCNIVHINSDVLGNNLNNMRYREIISKSQWFINTISDSSDCGISQHTVEIPVGEDRNRAIGSLYDPCINSIVLIHCINGLIPMITMLPFSAMD